jgi:hypothetical protein
LEKTTFELHPTCYECKFSDQHIREDKQVVRICRFNPPITAYAFVTNPTGGGAIMSNSLWTEVRNGDWCSKLEPRVGDTN